MQSSTGQKPETDKALPETCCRVGALVCWLQSRMAELRV